MELLLFTTEMIFKSSLIRYSYFIFQECRQAFPSEDSVDFTTCALNQCNDGAASWHEWGPWNKCSQSCGGGKSLRYFVVKK